MMRPNHHLDQNINGPLQFNFQITLCRLWYVAPGKNKITLNSVAEQRAIARYRSEGKKKMVWQGCSIHGSVNDSNFNEPMPWIGIYVAAASLVCSLAMAVATNLSVDLNTSMPRCQDQLSKLSSTVLMCTVMGNFMPSIGTTENKEVFSNVIALDILMITLMVNVCIKMGTGVIYVFWKEHAVLMFIMLVLLLILSFSALTVPTTKHYFEFKYCKTYEITVRESSNEAGIPVFKKLREDLMKYWTMAYTCCPQFVKGRSVTCTAAGALCLFSAAILVEAWLFVS
ncbi:hypothetical protein CK203_074489 [Vitis vinifera]|uniref:Uncharacterized protein n=1 Tax=Vitis vinifera TaxID=29760 RepID=A0A438ERZ5_VITVI|nr:hypothetical protein CK203_074489 [Vitis vinifera]